jgi:hypothetical protein
MPIPSQIGAKGEDRQGEQDNPGQQAQGQAEGNTVASERRQEPEPGKT